MWQIKEAPPCSSCKSSVISWLGSLPPCIMFITSTSNIQPPLFWRPLRLIYWKNKTEDQSVFTHDYKKEMKYESYLLGLYFVFVFKWYKVILNIFVWIFFLFLPIGQSTEKCYLTHFGQMYYTQKSCVTKIQKFAPGFCQGSLHFTKKQFDWYESKTFFSRNPTNKTFQVRCAGRFPFVGAGEIENPSRFIINTQILF